MYKFKVGDRVSSNQEDNKYTPYGLTGTVLEESRTPYVEWDEHVEGHSANGLGKEGHCSAENEYDLELVETSESKEPDRKSKLNISLALQVLELPNMTENLKHEASNILIKALQGEDNE